MKKILYLAGILLFVQTTYAQKCKLNDNARRHWARANVALKEAKNEAGYLEAAKEFKKALQYAPDCPDIYNQMAICYDKSACSGLLKDITGCAQAITFYKKYLEMKPNAQDKQEVQNKIYELEYKHEKLSEQIPEMVFVEGGTFMMGCLKDFDGECEDDEKPVHQVTVSSFHIGKYEITQKQWKAIMGNNPSDFKGDNLPVEQVSWNDVQEYITRLNLSTGKKYRLPTEAEWEYAALGGNKSRGYKYSGSNDLNNVGWYGTNSNSSTHPVGTLSPNELGIYDMSGNVWEWCNDWHGSYLTTSQSDPKGVTSGTQRVNRGGGWFYSEPFCRVANRGCDESDDRYGNLGFRLVLP